MADVVDITKHLRGCERCKWRDADMGACTRPGGYRMNMKLFVCVDFERKVEEGKE